MTATIIFVNLGMKILIVDDNQSVLRTLKLVLTPEFGQVVTMNRPEVIPALLDTGGFDAVLLDMNFDSSSLDGKDGLFWLERIKSRPDSPAVVMITAFGDVPLAVGSMKNGADDFVTKPWDNSMLIATLHRAILKNRAEKRERKAIEEAEEIRKRDADESGMTLDEMKSAHIRRTVERCGGNLSQAAELLGINRQTLYNQLKKGR